MIYDLVGNYFDKICEDIDFPDIVSKLYEIFEIDGKSDDSVKVLTEKFQNIFSLDAYELRNFIEDHNIDYPSLIMVGRILNPEFWTAQTVRTIQVKHQKLIDELDSDGKIKKCNLTQNLDEVKSMLLRYFDLLPEEENHDEELGVELLKLLKLQKDLNKTMKYTEINIISLIKLSHELTPKFWITNNGKTLRVKLLKFNSIDRS